MVAGVRVAFAKILVEAAGVEPASENVTGQETTCLVQFMLPAFTGNVRGPRSEWFQDISITYRRRRFRTRRLLTPPMAAPRREGLRCD